MRLWSYGFAIGDAAQKIENGSESRGYSFNNSLSCFGSVTGALQVKFSQT